MPDRIVKLALETYLNTAGMPSYGLQGQTVAVHAKDVKRFDKHNVDPGPPAYPPR